MNWIWMYRISSEWRYFEGKLILNHFKIACFEQKTAFLRLPFYVLKNIKVKGRKIRIKI